jgi:ribosomal protein S18 acetylase RimI-like enzyme
MPQIATPALTLRTRLATSADAARLIPLINTAFAIETFLEGTRTDAERLAAMMREGNILLAEDDAGQLIGCVYTEVHGTRGYLGQLAVAPERQGRGLARRFVEAAEQHLREQGCDAVDLSVLNHRTELPPLYGRFGYEITGTKEFVSSRPLKPGVKCHCIVMSKSL